MSIKNRKIGFYAIKLKNNKSDDFEDPKILSKVLSYISNLHITDRIYDIKSSNKFHVMEKLYTYKQTQTIIIGSAKYNHRPKLINKDTAQERDNPKTLIEGEHEKTHIAIKYKEDEVILVIEERKVGIAVSVFMTYLRRFAKEYHKSISTEMDYSFEPSIIAKDNFLKELKKLKRITIGDIYIDKNMLTSNDFLNFSGKLDSVQEIIPIEIRAKRGLSIKEVAEESYTAYFSKGSRVKKIRIYGKNKDGNSIILDTDLLKRIEYIKVSLNEETGIVDSDDILIQLEETLRVL